MTDSMNCDTARRALWPDPAAHAAPAAARRHFARCPACRRFFEAQAALGRRLARIGADAAPPGIEGRVRAVLARAPATPARRARRRWWSLAGLAAAAGIILMIGVGPSGNLASPFVAQGIEVAFSSSDLGEVEAWLAGELGRAVRLPAITGARLEGARVVMLDARPVAAAVYRLRGERLAYFALSDSTVSGELVRPHDEIRTATYGPWEVAVWGEPEGARAVMAAMPRDEVMAIAAECRNKALMRTGLRWTRASGLPAPYPAAPAG